MAALRLVARREPNVYLPETPPTNDAALMLLASLAGDQRVSNRGRVSAVCQFRELVRQRGVTLEEAARIHLDLRNKMPADAFVPEGFSVTGFLTMVSRSMAWPKALRRRASRALGVPPIRRD
jgi:hypothetical protein